MKAKTMEERIEEEVRKRTEKSRKEYEAAYIEKCNQHWDSVVRQVKTWMPMLMKGLVSALMWMMHCEHDFGHDRNEKLLMRSVDNLGSILRAVDWRNDIENASDKAFAWAVEKCRTILHIDVNDEKYKDVFDKIIVIDEGKE